MNLFTEIIKEKTSSNDFMDILSNAFNKVSLSDQKTPKKACLRKKANLVHPISTCQESSSNNSRKRLSTGINYSNFILALQQNNTEDSSNQPIFTLLKRDEQQQQQNSNNNHGRVSKRTSLIMNHNTIKSIMLTMTDPQDNNSSLTKTINNMKPIEPDELKTLIKTSKHSPLFIDMRPLDMYENSHIQNSIHINVPTLLIKRYRKGVISNFNLESFISTLEATHNFKDWLNEFQVQDIQQLPESATIVIYDQHMSEADKQAAVWVVLAVIQKNTRAKVTWLNSGFNKFEMWNVKHEFFPLKTKKVPVKSEIYSNSPIIKASLFNLDTDNAKKQTHKPELPKTRVITPKTENEYDFVISEIIPNFLYLGPEIVTAEHLAGLKSKSIKRILNMAEECDDNVPGLKDYFKYKKIAARDTVEMQNVQETLKKAVQVINDAKKHHEAIYVHCQAGKSRSVTAILAYLIISEHWTLKRAYQHVAKARPNISPNIGFVAELMKIEQKVHGQVSNFVGLDWWTQYPASPDTLKDLVKLEKAWKKE